MAEEVQIPILTTLRTEGTKLFIKSQFFEDTLPNTILAFLGEDVSSLESVLYIEGELVIQLKNYPTAINYTLNSSGNLLVTSNTGDASNYSINTNGELIWVG